MSYQHTHKSHGLIDLPHEWEKDKREVSLDALGDYLPLTRHQPGGRKRFRDGRMIAIEPVSSPSPEGSVIAAIERRDRDDQRRALAAAFAELPERERAVLVMRFGLGSPPVDQRGICSRLGISRKTSYNLQRRGIARLRALTADIVDGPTRVTG